MKILHTTLLHILLFVCLSSTIYSQDYYVTYLKDTVFCSNLKFSSGGNGNLNYLSYTDKSGKKVETDKKKNLQHIHTLFSSDTTYDWMPLKTKKPLGYHRFGRRVLTGKLKVNYYNDVHEITTFNPNKPAIKLKNEGPYQTSSIGTRLFQVTLPDGKIYSVKRKNIKKVIKPYLLQCKAFTEKYSGDFSAHEQDFIAMIKLYNAVCK